MPFAPSIERPRRRMVFQWCGRLRGTVRPRGAVVWEDVSDSGAGKPSPDSSHS